MNDASRRCTATNRAGERCGRAPIVGGAVCVIHGGKNPIVVKAAHERLLEMFEPALAVVHRALRQAPPCDKCGRSDSDRDPVAVGAAFKLMDRIGLGPQLKLELSQGSEFAGMSFAEIADRAEAIALACRALAIEEGAARALASAIDVEVVDAHPE